MAYEIINYPGYTEYNVVNGYENGMDETCPCCGTHLDNFGSPDFLDGVIQVYAKCPTCGKVLTFNYFLDNIVAEGGNE